MRFTTVIHQGRQRHGVVADNEVHLAADDGRQLVDVLRAGGMDALLAQGRASAAERIPLPAQLPPLLGEPARCICVGLNYRDHVEEMERKEVGHPTLFMRHCASLVGHGQGMVKPTNSDMYDYEGELAVVIGKAGRHIPAAHALDHVGGYTCVNDGSMRDWQGHSTQFTAGKNFQQSGAIGPWLVSADEAGDPRGLTLETRLNGKVVQNSGCDILIFDIPTLITYISDFMELLPGDVISTGTPSGVGMGRTPRLFMKPGDQVAVEISGIGCLENTIVAEQC